MTCSSFVPWTASASAPFRSRIAAIIAFLSLAEPVVPNRRITAEESRMKSLPMETFERLLPYAIAFGIHDRWIKAFAGLFDANPEWLDTDRTDWGPRIFRRSINDLGSDVSSNMRVMR